MSSQRRHQARGQARRDALLAATVDVAAERGTGGVTHRSVTERAGMPLATVSYFFASIDQLAAEAMRVFTAARTAELVALAATLGADHRSPDEIAEALAAAAVTRRTWSLAQFEAYLHAARTPEFRPAVAEAVAAFEDVAGVALRAAGARDPAPLVAAFVALADGFAVRNLALPGSLPADALHRAFRALYLGSILDEDSIDEDPVGVVVGALPRDDAVSAPGAVATAAPGTVRVPGTASPA